MEDVAQRCIEIIARSKSIPVESISLSSNFDELAVDSLDKINISFEVEDLFDIEIPDDALSTLKTVGDVVEGVRKLLAAKAAKHAPQETQ
jgi:acyl carrier protein